MDKTYFYTVIYRDQNISGTLASAAVRKTSVIKGIAKSIAEHDLEGKKMKVHLDKVDTHTWFAYVETKDNYALMAITFKVC